MLKWRYMGTINQVGVWVIKKAMLLRIGSGYWLLQLKLCANEIQLLIQDRTRNTQIAAQLFSCVWELIVSLKVVCIKKSYKSFYIVFAFCYSHMCFNHLHPAWPAGKIFCFEQLRYQRTTHAWIFEIFEKQYTFHSSWLEHITNWAEINELFLVYRVCCARLTQSLKYCTDDVNWISSEHPDAINSAFVVNENIFFIVNLIILTIFAIDTVWYW